LPEIPNWFVHLEAGEQLAVTANVQVMAESAGATLSSVGEGCLCGSPNGFACFEDDAVEGLLEMPATLKYVSSSLASTSVQDPEA
jgi:hypothetical protein